MSNNLALSQVAAAQNNNYGMIDWIKTAQWVAAIVAAIFATMVPWWNLGLPRLVFSPELAPLHRRIEVARAIRTGHPAPGVRPDPGGAPIRS